MWLLETATTEVVAGPSSLDRSLVSAHWHCPCCCRCRHCLCCCYCFHCCCPSTTASISVAAASISAAVALAVFAHAAPAIIAAQAPASAAAAAAYAVTASAAAAAYAVTASAAAAAYAVTASAAAAAAAAATAAATTAKVIFYRTANRPAWIIFHSTAESTPPNGREKGHCPPTRTTRTCFFAWLTGGSCWILDCSCFDYGPRLLHIMRQGLASLPAVKREKRQGGESAGQTQT